MVSTALLTITLLIIGTVLVILFYNPYRYPYHVIDIDVSGRRNVDIEEEIEQYIIDEGISEFQSHCNFVKQWKDDTSQKAHSSVIDFIRVQQYSNAIDDEHVFVFNLRRNQTRYRQRNYVKTSYVVSSISDRFTCSYDYIISRYNVLKGIDFETTTKKYYTKNQRKQMTPQLRQQIIQRDNYTCQKCGKHMSDGVGLQIDHIIPISKGGKTVASNLQVLCSKCNGSKSNKLA